jgi:hypothetical protein
MFTGERFLFELGGCKRELERLRRELGGFKPNVARYKKNS